MTRFLCACGTSYDTHTATRVPYHWLLSWNTTFAIRPKKFSPEIRSTASIVGKGRKSFAIKTSGSFGNVYAAVIELADQISLASFVEYDFCDSAEKVFSRNPLYSINSG